MHGILNLFHNFNINKYNSCSGTKRVTLTKGSSFLWTANCLAHRKCVPGVHVNIVFLQSCCALFDMSDHTALRCLNHLIEMLDLPQRPAKLNFVMCSLTYYRWFCPVSLFVCQANRKLACPLHFKFIFQSGHKPGDKQLSKSIIMCIFQWKNERKKCFHRSLKIKALSRSF